MTAAMTLVLVLGFGGTRCFAQRQRLEVGSYVIDAALDPRTHHLTARAQVQFKALEDLTIAIFELHNGLHPTRVTDAQGNALTVERVAQDATLHVSLPNGLNKGQSTTLTFEYEGGLATADDSPVPGLKLAYVGEPFSYLLYAGRWFPVAGYGTNRFTATMRISVPEGITVIGSGAAEKPVAAAPAAATVDANGVMHSTAHARKPASTSVASGTPAVPAPVSLAKPGDKTYTFVWDKPGFPGDIFAGQYEETVVEEGGSRIHVYFAPGKSDRARECGETVAKELAFFTSSFGLPPTEGLKVVELPDDSVPMAWAPEVAALSTTSLSGKQYYRLLANAVSRQWWGGQLSPATRNDAWITEGGARYSEALYVEFAAGRAAYDDAIKDMQVGALAYESVPIAQSGTLDPFDPVFQSMTIDKGGMVYHMLRGVLGERKFDQFMRDLQTKYAGSPVSSGQLQQVAEAANGEQLAWFFSQWLDSTGAPEFQNKYTIFRVKGGFRTTGQITQDLDLFRMPVELRIETDGKPETRQLVIEGTSTAYSVDTFGKPRKVIIDPGNWVLRNSPEIKLRSAILRGQQLRAQGSYVDALHEFQKALEENRNSSLVHYNIAEVYYLQKNYQPAANAYRDALNGDGQPRWTEVWSHLRLGNIFDATGQRERAVNEYRQSLQTGDNTQGALDQARRYMKEPFQRGHEE
jgi:tetratricopeptide (TPR) repeat protein